MQHGGATVHAGIPRRYPGVYGDAPVTAGRHGYMPVGPRLRPGVTLHYKFRIKTWSNVSFLLSLLHNSYVFKEMTPNRHKLDCTATYGRWRLQNSD